MQLFGLDGWWDSITDVAHIWLAFSLQNIITFIPISVMTPPTVVTLCKEVVRIVLVVPEIARVVFHREVFPKTQSIILFIKYWFHLSRLRWLDWIVYDAKTSLLLLSCVDGFEHSGRNCLSKLSKGRFKVLIGCSCCQTKKKSYG